VYYVQRQINYLDWEGSTLKAGACYEVAARHGKKIIVMEPVKGGSLAALPEEAAALLREMHPDWSPASWAVRFAQSLPAVEIVLSGMGTMEQVEDNLQEVEPLTAEELALLARAAEIIRKNTAIPCTACNYCAPNCPKKIVIPQYFNLYNEYSRSPGEGWKMGHAYRTIAAENGSPADCIACGACERNCPQKLPIIEHLKQVEKAFSES
jgi:predicted aldo/keto reductase-like oxidoreductase